MDAGLLKALADIGAVGILLYVLLQVLNAYRLIVGRVTDLLQIEIEEDKGEEK